MVPLTSASLWMKMNVNSVVQLRHLVVQALVDELRELLRCFLLRQLEGQRIPEVIQILNILQLFNSA